MTGSCSNKKDDAAEAGWDPEEHPQSVKTGRTNDEVVVGVKAPAKKTSTRSGAL